jgi:hypothetical protein
VVREGSWYSRSFTNVADGQDQKWVSGYTMIDAMANARSTGSADDIWSLTWSPEEGEDVKYTLVPWVDMSNGELAAFQHGLNACLKKRLDSPGAIPVGEIHKLVLRIVANEGNKLTEDLILVEALEELESVLALG